jgi:DNA-directed RNA polymerase subunit K/omega
MAKNRSSKEYDEDDINDNEDNENIDEGDEDIEDIEDANDEDIEEDSDTDIKDKKKLMTEDHLDSEGKDYEDKEYIDDDIDISDVDKDDDYIENNIFEVSNKNIINILNKKKTTKYLTGNDRISRPVLTLYEKVRILGERENQLTLGAKPLVKYNTKLSYREIAEEEFKLNKIPFKIIRQLPNGTTELWKLEELLKL